MCEGYRHRTKGNCGAGRRSARMRGIIDDAGCVYCRDTTMPAAFAERWYVTTGVARPMAS
jgi:hypothetical protein